MRALGIAQRIGLRDPDADGAARDHIEEIARGRFELGARQHVVA